MTLICCGVGWWWCEGDALLARTTELGNLGEDFVDRLLAGRGYSTTRLGGRFETYDIQVISTDGPFMVSVKTSRNKQHVRLGSEKSVARLAAPHFVIAVLPLDDDGDVALESGKCRVLIIPAEVAKADGLRVTESYFAEDSTRKRWETVMVKGYSRRPIQEETWERWLSDYTDAWHLLPSAKSMS